MLQWTLVGKEPRSATFMSRKRNKVIGIIMSSFFAKGSRFQWRAMKRAAVCLMLSALYGAAAAVAGTLTHVPILLDGSPVFVPVFKPACTPADVCITWTERTYVAISSGFVDDAGFNYADDTNKVHRINNLYYYTSSIFPVSLQCTNSQGQWVNVQSSTNDSHLSVINSLNPNGQPHNSNSAFPDFPVFQHRWPGTLLANATNCHATSTNLYAPITSDYTYKHVQKSLKLRAVYFNGAAAHILPADQNSNECRMYNLNPNLWQRTLDCVGAQRPTTIDIPVNEVITRVSNFTDFSVLLNASNGDYWVCSYEISIDGVSKGNWGNILNPPTATASWSLRNDVEHTIGFRVIQCQARAGCIASTSSCNNYNTASGSAPSATWILNPKYTTGPQTFDFNLPQPQ